MPYYLVPVEAADKRAASGIDGGLVGVLTYRVAFSASGIAYPAGTPGKIGVAGCASPRTKMVD
jgi:hypothetical protein